ncbi:thioesterase domain-containing protein, putative [Andreprevotia lacus DSM 23236]|jgi:thioesterase domain-containing protein|uniref:Thioesterase domain-containing protein, putative n=1 Tax=Andreprevotia lacus DSM 23236 TaxID=1121001 RepID=A0A1W1Y0S1_9NEIS|nr:YiiD C-terminal domain-containing protein [Andreprevotia lacus]SMC29763.1 thioesterase domain-containing protein, putative [Andreprevotia lacus DSM 23236]
MVDFARHWTRRLNDGFPVLAAMQVQVEGTPFAWYLTAPFAANHNDHGTAFGGSLSTLATIAGWMSTSVLAGDGYDVVIQTGNTEFIAPLRDDLFARPLPVDQYTAQRFLQTLSRRNKARLSVQVTLLDAQGETVALFSGLYVATALPAGNPSATA